MKAARAADGGLVLGVWSMVTSGAYPLGSLLAGDAADRWGETVVLLGQGLGIALAAAVVLLLAARVRRDAPSPHPEPDAAPPVG